MTAVRPASRPRVATVASIFDVDPARWDAHVSDDGFYVSHGWLRAMSRGWPHPERCLVLESGGGLPLYLSPESDGGAYDPSALLGVSGDGLFPLLLVGSRFGFASEPVLPAAGRSEAGQALLDAVPEVAAELGAAASGLLYVPDRVAAELGDLLRDAGYVVYLETFEARLPVEWASFDEYLASLSSKRRYAVRRELAAPERSGLRIRRTAQAGLAHVMAPLLANVERRHGNLADAGDWERRLERNEAEVGEASVLFVLEAGERAVGFSLAYRWRTGLFLRAVGFDYGFPRLRDTYFSLLVYEPLRYALEHGLRVLHLGTGSLEPKVGRGAELRPLWTALRPSRPDPELERKAAEAQRERLASIDSKRRDRVRSAYAAASSSSEPARSSRQSSV
jgi:predicted N-acyltransferase